MEVNCPKCGTRNWLENQSRCLACDTILRRCADCTNYQAAAAQCRALSADVDNYEAQNPSLLSISTNCAGYRCAQKV